MKTNFIQKRYAHTHDSSASLLFDKGVFITHILEDEPRVEKIAGETRIPAGTYEIVKCFQSGILNRMRAKGFKWDWIPTLVDVPGFTYVRFHWGNREKDTDGCLLPGLGMNFDGEYATLNSRGGMEVLMEHLNDAFDLGTVWLTITDEGDAL